MAWTIEIYITILGKIDKEPAIGLAYLVLYSVDIIPLLIIVFLVFFGIPSSGEVQFMA
jgi:hypothetical protein